jgi:ribonuclease HII
VSGLLAGVDEAGRGPLAGPVVAAAVILDPRRPVAGLRDSKQLSPARRAQLALCIRRCALGVAVAEADAAEIDLFNVLQATLLAMKWALLALPIRPAGIIIDGNTAPQLHDCFADCIVRTQIRGDALVPCVSAASIIAKTYRDGLMRAWDRRYPGYGLADHYGYATSAHLAALGRLGPSPIHRRSFNPLRGWLQAGRGAASLPPDGALCDPTGRG